MTELIASPRPGPDSVPDADGPPPTPGAPDDREENQRLRARYAEISQLAGVLAHEIRNPLSTMSLNLDLLGEEFPNPESARDRRVVQKIERLRRDSLRLQDILENFLRFARVQELRLETADLNVVVGDLRDFFEPQAMTQGIVIRTQFEPDLPRMSLDVDLFRQALLNLFINARQAMPDGGELLLRTRSDGPWNVLEVTDTGVGMTADVRDRVFDAFYSTRPGGSGLGLPTTRKIVEAHGGTIGVESEPGKGSQFTLRLPNHRDHPDPDPRD
jgi:signal transduction histidine kinase